MRAIFRHLMLGSLAFSVASCAVPYYAAGPAPVYYPMQRARVYYAPQSASIYYAPPNANTYLDRQQATGSKPHRAQRPPGEERPTARSNSRPRSGTNSDWIDPEP